MTNGVDKAKVVAALKTVLKAVPTAGIVLNCAQHRALKAAYTFDPLTGSMPALNIISFANGVGKTTLLLVDIAGWTMGHEYLNWWELPHEAVIFYKSLAELRDAGRLSLRLVCDSEDMKAGGSVYESIMSLLPTAKLTAPDQNRCFRQIDIPHPTIKGVVNRIAVKTFDQDVKKHSGSNCNRVWINEPLPDNLVGETVGRIRSAQGKLQGSIMMCATLLSEAAWVQEMDDDPALRMVHTRAHLYEACVGELVTDQMAGEVLSTVGTKLVPAAEVTPNGKGYITKGVLSKEQIDSMVAIWRKGSPTELEARMTGAPISGGGRIYPTFNRHIHTVDEYKPNPAWTLAHVVDPHGAKPSFSLWAQVTPQNRIYIFDEWPNASTGGFYTDLSERPYTIRQECEVFDRVELMHGIKGKDIIRIGDPNRFYEPDIYKGGTLADEYKRYGFDFFIGVDDDLQLGHSVVCEYLYADEARLANNPNDLAALPRLFVSKNCINTIRALENYSMKKVRKGTSVTENVNEKYKDAADCVRYLAMYFAKKTFASMQNGDTSNKDYRDFCNGRVSAIYRQTGTGW